MARNNIYLGTLAGKLGDNVFWRAKGQQRVRTYVPRTEAMVGYEAAERRARFANLKGIYQWLPEPFKQACSLHRIGGNSYADFMMQYNSFNEERMRSTFGAGRFLPVNCKISNGTWGQELVTAVAPLRANLSGVGHDQLLGMPIRLTGAAIQSDEWSDWSYQLIRQYSWLHEGDKMHVLFGWLRYDDTAWGEPDAVEGFPFAYNNVVYKVLTLDSLSSRTINELSDSLLYSAYDEADENNVQGLVIKPTILTRADYQWISIVAGLMFERPSAPRQQRYTPARLHYEHSQKMILNADARGRWNDYCTRSFMKG